MSAAAGKDRIEMSQMRTFAAIFALGAGLAGCATPPTNGLTPANNPSLYSLHQPVVQRTDFVFDTTTDGSGLPASEQARLNDWFASIDLRYGDQVMIDEAPGYESAAARSDVASVAARYGLLLVNGAPITTGSIAPGTVRVIATRASASVPSCPDWSGGDMHQTGTTSSNYGCATNSNLAAMIASPNDLVEGQDGTVGRNAANASRAIRSYREAQPTGRNGLSATSTAGN
jgi:pilus assembly protein CpaD